MQRLVVFIILLAGIFAGEYFWPKTPALADAQPENQSIVPAFQPLETKSEFKESFEAQTQKLLKTTVYKDDPETEAGNDTVSDEGENGERIITTKITYYKNEEYSRQQMEEKTIPARDKIISRGTKIVWKTLIAPDGEIRYWKKMRVYATHYDSHCLGCGEWTATGMRQGKGIIAVDPKVIPLYSKVYVPGYGLSIAGDTGGAIKGNIIDLGFEDAKTAGWYAHYIDIYLL